MIATIYCYFLIAIFNIHSGSGKGPEKIAGGSSAEIEHFPYLVSIQNSITHNCGGSFIDLNHILTAAHCLVDRKNVLRSDILIYSGSNDFKRMTSRHEIAVVVTNVNFKPKKCAWEHDIAILKLQEPIDSTPSRKPFSYITKIEPPAGSIAFFSGWGLSPMNSTTPSRYLQKIELHILSHEACEEMMAYTIHRGVFCTTNIENGNLHEGDSGGALIYNGEIIGIATARLRSKSIQLFVRIYAYKSWIQKMIKKY